MCVVRCLDEFCLRLLLPRGKIKYYTHPPEVSAGTHIASEIVMKMSRQFDIDSLLEDEKNTLKGRETATRRVLTM